MPSNWRRGFQWAYMQPEPEPDGAGSRLARGRPRLLVGFLAQPAAGHRSCSSPRTGRWVAYLRLEHSPGRSPITTLGRFSSVEDAQVPTDEVWVPR
jgi:hypothetical protein